MYACSELPTPQPWKARLCETCPDPPLVSQRWPLAMATVPEDVLHGLQPDGRLREAACLPDERERDATKTRDGTGP